jgi:hypothetical protein
MPAGTTGIIRPSSPEIARSTTESASPEKIAVSHIPVSKPGQVTPETPPEKEGEEKPAVGGMMISAEGIYSILIELPNTVMLTIRPSVGKELAISPEEEKMLKDWSMTLYDYCMRHGYTIPDYLELLPLVLTPAAFYLNRIRVVISAEEKKEKKPEPPIEIGVTEEPQNEEKAVDKVDMRGFEKSLGKM